MILIDLQFYSSIIRYSTKDVNLHNTKFNELFSRHYTVQVFQFPMLLLSWSLHQVIGCLWVDYYAVEQREHVESEHHYVAQKIDGRQQSVQCERQG